MATVFRFKRVLEPARPLVRWSFEGAGLTAREGDTVAAALLANGIDYTRTTPVGKSPRAPFCMMGTCFECLMEIDGVPNQQACQIVVTEDMNVKRMLGARAASLDYQQDTEQAWRKNPRDE